MPVPVSPGQLQSLTQRCDFPDDLAEVVLGADLLLEVRLFLVQLVPECLDFLEGQGVRDGDRDLIGNEVQELQLGFLVGIRLLAREAERPDPAPSGGQRKIAAALHSIRGRSFRETRPTRLPTHVRDDQRALRLPDPARWEVLDRNSRRGRGYGFEGLQNVQAHRVGRRLMHEHGQVIEADDLVEPLRQLVEQRRQIAVRDDRFRNRQQGPVLPIGRQHRGFLLRQLDGGRHAGSHPVVEPLLAGDTELSQHDTSSDACLLAAVPARWPQVAGT